MRLVDNTRAAVCLDGPVEGEIYAHYSHEFLVLEAPRLDWSMDQLPYDATHIESPKQHLYRWRQVYFTYPYTTVPIIGGVWKVGEPTDDDIAALNVVTFMLQHGVGWVWHAPFLERHYGGWQREPIEIRRAS